MDAPVDMMGRIFLSYKESQVSKSFLICLDISLYLCTMNEMLDPVVDSAGSRGLLNLQKFTETVPLLFEIKVSLIQHRSVNL